MNKWWVSGKRRGTGQVNTDRFGKIVFVPSIWKVFMGQPFENLKRWLRDDGLRVEKL